MSTRVVLNQLVEKGRVVLVPPAERGVQSARHLFLEASIHKRLQEAMLGSTKEDSRLAMLYADLDRYSSGRAITVGNDPFEKDKSAFMARTCPVQDGVFDIRSADPSPAIRLFGAFCEKDVFLGLTWRWRKELGGRDQKLFDFAVMAATRVWDEYLPGCQRLYSDNLEDYISAELYVV